jgi:hypothetical protein
VTSGRAGAEGPPAAVLERFAAQRVARLVDHYSDDWTALWWVELQGTAAVLEGAAAEAALDALADRYTPYRADRPPGPVVAVTPRRWAWWSAS